MVGFLATNPQIPHESFRVVNKQTCQVYKQKVIITTHYHSLTRFCPDCAFYDEKQKTCKGLFNLFKKRILL